jgi:hypothetical protein
MQIGGAVKITSAAGVILNGRYNRIGIFETSNLIYLFVQGVLVGTVSDSFGLGASSVIMLGCTSFTIGLEVCGGMFDEFRFTAGVCRHTTNYTPDTAQFPDSA